MLGWWWKRSEKHRANKQQGDPHALDVEGDPRGGVQNQAYRSAEPTELVEEDGVVMSGPAGAPAGGRVAGRAPQARPHLGTA
jgi:hypothetical protein